MTIPQQRYRTTPARRRPSRRTSRLTRIHWGWWVAAVIAALVAVQQHPVISACALTLVVASVIVAAVRPRRFARLFHRIDQVAARIPERSAIPRQASLGHLQTMHWSKFEQAVIARAEQSPYVARASLTGKTGDRGCDGIVTLTNGARVLIQCKRYKNTKKINGETVRSTDGAMRQAGCNLSVIVTTSDFTTEGQIAAAALGVIPFDGAATTDWFRGGRAPWEPAY